MAATYSYDAFGQLTAASENFGSGTTWTNPYRYDGRDGVRYDGETGLSWMSVRAYDPALGRFLSRDPLGRVPLFFADQPYVYGGNNPLSNVDPSGQFELTDGMSHVQARQARAAANQKYIKWFRMQLHPGKRVGNGGRNSVSCRISENQGNGTACEKWRKWRDGMKTLQGNQVQQVRNAAFGLAMGGLGTILVGIFVQAFAVNDPIRMVEIAFAGFEVVADGLSWAASSFPKYADTIYGWLGAVTAFLGALNAFNAIVHGVAAWLLWTIRGTVMAGMLAAKGPIAVIISLMLGLAGSVAQTVGQGLMTDAITKYADAAKQENMSVWDWCAGSGIGQCTDEPNGGMPIA